MTRVVLTLALLAGCGREAAWPPQPVPVALGEESCAGCKMIISDPHYGAQLHDRRGGVQQFDDLGCWQKAAAAAKADPAASFVRSFADGAWIRADKAVLVRYGELHSPMGSGLAAFPTRSEAQAFAERHGDAVVLTALELIQ